MNLWRLLPTGWHWQSRRLASGTLALARKIAGYLLFLIIIGMATGWHLQNRRLASGTPAFADEVMLDRVVALVNNRPVLISEVNEYLSRLLPKSNPLEIKSDIPLSREMIIQKLVDEELIQQEAERQNIRGIQEDFEKAFEGIKKRNRMNTSQFILTLAKQGIPFQQFCKDLKREIRKSLIIRKEVINRIAISDALIQEAFEARKHKYANNHKIRLRQIFQPFNANSSEAEKKMLRRQMDGILSLLNKEGNFEMLAKRYSKDPNAPQGGDMGWINLDDIAKYLANAIQKLKKGEISGLIESPFGLHIVKVEDIRNEAGPSLEEVKESLRKELFEKEFWKRYKAWSKGLRDAAHIEIRLNE